jgi:hypothetical protein
MADALHEAAVAGDHIGVVIDQLGSEARGQHALGQRHANRIAEPLAQGASRGLDTWRMAVFRVARGAAAELAEVAQLLERHLGIAGQIEQRIKQHRAVAGREHEPVAVRPGGVGGVVFQEPREQDGGHIRHAHRHPGMAGIGLLDRIHGQRPDGVGEVRMAGSGGGSGAGQRRGAGHRASEKRAVRVWRGVRPTGFAWRSRDRGRQAFRGRAEDAPRRPGASTLRRG